MGRGDIKTKKGKISNGSYGNSRKRKVGVSYPASSNNAVSETAEKEVAKKAPKKAKKTTEE